MTFLTRPTQVWVKHGVRALGCLLVLALVNIGSSQAQELAEPEAEPSTLATFHLSNGNTVEFHGVPAKGGAEGGIGYAEKGNIGESMPIFYSNEELTILQKFLILAPEDTPLPRMLVESGAADYEERLLAKLDSIDDLSKAGVPSIDRLIAERGIVEELPELLEIELNPLELVEKFQTYAQGVPYLDEQDEQSKGFPAWGGGTWSCTQPWGARRFRGTFCFGSPPRFQCDEGQNRRNIFHGSYGLAVRDSFSVDAYCGGIGGGGSYVKPRYQWRDNTRRWHLIWSGPEITRGEWGWTQWTGDSPMVRRVWHDKEPDRLGTGYFRAFTAFFNDPGDGGPLG